MNASLNKKVKKYLDSYFRDTKVNSPEHHEAVMLVLRGALTDANFHSEAKQLGKYFPKAGKKYIGTPMEDVIEDKGIGIAKMAKWDGYDIIDAFAFYLSMSIGGSFGNRLMSLKESLEESLVSEGERLDEKNCPTNPSKWSYYKSQAKKKFDVYPSAYANGWASKQYKAAGGGWKSCKKESIDEKMVTPKSGHNYYQLYRDTPIKYVSGHSGIGLEVPGVLLHNEYDTIKGKKGAYIIDYFGAHFYVDIKNKFASRIAHPDNREQNKDLRKNMGRTALAPEHKDWKKYMNESVVNELNVKTYRSAVEKGLERGDDKGKEIATKAIQLMGREIAKELNGISLEIKPTKVEQFHKRYFNSKPPMTGQYQMTFTGQGQLHLNGFNINTQDVTLFLKADVATPVELGGWGGPVELQKYRGGKSITFQVSLRNGSVEVYPYGANTTIQFTRSGARLLAASAASMHIALGGDGKIKHNKIKQFTPHKNESVNEADKATLDTVSRRMFGKSYSRLTMDQAARVKASLREAMVSPKSGHNYYQLTKDVPVRYVAYQTNPTGATGVMLHNTPGHLKGKKGAYIIDYYGGHYYVDMKSKFATAIYDLDQQSFYRKPVYKEVDSAPDFASWKSYKKEIPFKRESVNEGKYDDMLKDGYGHIHFVVKNLKIADELADKIEDKDLGDTDIYKDKGKSYLRVALSVGYGGREVSNIKKIEKIVGMRAKAGSPEIWAADDLDESTSRTAMEIGGLTGMNKDAIQKFVDDNNLDIEKVYQFVKKGKLADRMKLVSAIAGKPNNPVQKKMAKQFSESLIKEAKVRLGSDSVNFKVMGDNKGLTLIAASGNDLDSLQDAIANDVDVKGELRKTLEKQLKVPVEIDQSYSGAGFRFNIDFYSLAKKVK